MQAGNEGSLPFFPCSSSPNLLTMVSDFLFLLELKLGWGEEKIYTRMRKFLYDYYHCNVALCSLGLDDVNFNFFFFSYGTFLLLLWKSPNLLKTSQI